MVIVNGSQIENYGQITVVNVFQINIQYEMVPNVSSVTVGDTIKINFILTSSKDNQPIRSLITSFVKVFVTDVNMSQESLVYSKQVVTDENGYGTFDVITYEDMSGKYIVIEISVPSSGVN